MHRAPLDAFLYSVLLFSPWSHYNYLVLLRPTCPIYTTYSLSFLYFPLQLLVD
uniref:Uncharacterized protein n=1 Tax=Picea glauca TaxID=3330 RepID=A0A101M5F1_PICGL|nr:hypothetical protein ABT39_MTgene1116 [Picea glauca]QHR87767.1 hypothetical protein Q903MT_gene1779 [Picea sitchensis]